MKLTLTKIKNVNKKFWAIALAMVLAFSGVHFGAGQIFGQEGEYAPGNYEPVIENEYQNLENNEVAIPQEEAVVGAPIGIVPLHDFANGGFVAAGETVVLQGDVLGNITVHGTLILDAPWTITGTGQHGSAEGSAAVNVQQGGRFIMSDGVVTSPSNIGVLVNGDAATSVNVSTFDMHGGVITNSIGRPWTSDAGSAVVVNRGGIFNMHNGEISGNVSTVAGAVGVRDAGSTFSMYGGTITRNTASSGGAVQIEHQGTFNMAGGTLDNNTATGAGGAVIATGVGSIFNMMGGEIINNQATQGGGAVRVVSHAQFMLNGANARIFNNQTSADGGAVSLDGGVSTIGAAPAEFVMLNGVIENNHATGAGGAVRGTTAAIVQLIGGRIIDNRAGAQGGAVSLISNSTVYIQNAIIEGNQSVGHGGAMHINASTLTMTGGRIENNRTTGVNANGVLSGDGGGINVTGAAGNITLVGGVVANNTARDGGGVWIGGNATLNMPANSTAQIIDNTAERNGGGVWIIGTTPTGTTLNLESGLIAGNSAAVTGGGINVTSGQNVTIAALGVEITRNQSVGSGGGISVSGGNHIVGNVNIHNNQSTGTDPLSSSDGGGINVGGVGTTFILQSGVTENNQAQNGGGINVAGGSTFTLDGGVVRNNTARISGGGFNVNVNAGANLDAPNMNTSTLNIVSGEISGNTAASDGGGVFLNRRAHVNMTGTDFRGNSSTAGNGGAMFVLGDESVLNVTGGTFTNNTAQHGGAIGYSVGSHPFYEGRLPNITIDDIEFSQNVARLGVFISNRLDAEHGERIFGSISALSASGHGNFVGGNEHVFNNYDVQSPSPVPVEPPPTTTVPETTEPPDEPEEPTTAPPVTTAPPTTVTPPTTAPATTVPEVTPPATTAPETTEPDATQPEMTQPETTEPEDTPPITEPEIDPGLTNPEMPPASEGNTVAMSPDGDFWIELDDAGVPLGTWTWDNEEEIWIFDTDVPLGFFPGFGTDDVPQASLPQTGVSSNSVMFALLFGGFAIISAGAAYMVVRTKRRVN